LKGLKYLSFANGPSLEFADPELKKDITVVLKALNEDETSILHVDPHLSMIVMDTTQNLSSSEEKFKNDIFKRAEINKNTLKEIYEKEGPKKKYKKIKVHIRRHSK
jgi:hypothetical protein